MNDDSVPNAIVRMTTIGFQHANGPTGFAELVDPYFDALVPVWDSRSYKMAEYLILGLYPAPLANENLIVKTRAWLEANADQPAALREGG